ncbi:unnamed protein product [Timema podura]|uniref:Broad-complex n=1 Tax=Timema podura TaxID=61482 RepID=A0ABN7NEL2_TIMPD|nr:unnamed protein product [Timema podura]
MKLALKLDKGSRKEKCNTQGKNPERVARVLDVAVTRDQMGEAADSEQQYSLRWNDFHASILSSFRHLRDEEDFVDVTLACDGCSFTAHKVVLSACSPYFRRLLKVANPCQHPIVILRDVKEKDMESLLRFMYNGEVHIGQDQLTDFLKTAQMLQVRGLADLKGNSDSSLQAHSTGEDSNSSDTAMSDRGGTMSDLMPILPKTEPNDYGSMEDNHHHHHHHPGNGNLGMDSPRTPSFPAALLSLQGIPGLLPGPSGLHNSSQDSNFGPLASCSVEGSGSEDGSDQCKPVCPECGRVYSTNSNLKQHIANVHSRSHSWESCHICGKHFKTRQYLHTHLLQTHGIRQRNLKHFSSLDHMAL